MLHMDGNKLIQKEHWADKEATVIHEIKDDEWTAVSLRCQFKSDSDKFFYSFFLELDLWKCPSCSPLQARINVSTHNPTEKVWMTFSMLIYVFIFAHFKSTV